MSREARIWWHNRTIAAIWAKCTGDGASLKRVRKRVMRGRVRLSREPSSHIIRRSVSGRAKRSIFIWRNAWRRAVEEGGTEGTKMSCWR